MVVLSNEEKTVRMQKKFKVKDLRDVIRQQAQDFKGYSTMKKLELVKFIVERPKMFSGVHKNLLTVSEKMQLKKDKPTKSEVKPTKSQVKKTTKVKNKVMDHTKELKLFEDKFEELQETEDEDKQEEGLDKLLNKVRSYSKKHFEMMVSKEKKKINKLIKKLKSFVEVEE